MPGGLQKRYVESSPHRTDEAMISGPQMARKSQSQARRGRRYQPMDPGSPLKGPTTLDVIQPP